VPIEGAGNFVTLCLRRHQSRQMLTLCAPDRCKQYGSCDSRSKMQSLAVGAKPGRKRKSRAAVNRTVVVSYLLCDVLGSAAVSVLPSCSKSLANYWVVWLFYALQVNPVFTWAQVAGWRQLIHQRDAPLTAGNL
jgi:hypothetical protein